MVFSSLIFIFRFLPIGFIIYFLTPKKMKNLSLLILSLIFYSLGEGKYFFIMVSSIVVDYSLSRAIEKYRDILWKRRALLVFSIIFNLGMLFIFKYINFFIGNINDIFKTTLEMVKLTLPLGISFYTFQTMTYTIDVYRGKIKAEKNIINFGTFVCLFPQLIAGPIVKYTDIKNELNERNITKEKVTEGIEIFIIGLGQKVLLGNSIGLLWEEVKVLDGNLFNTPIAWLGIIAFAFQIYFDFSGYSLMAMGLGKALGFTFPKNFNYPYISRSVSEFFRRWHMTLGNFFKEYVYITLGGNKKGKIRLVLNLFIVWALTGFWHGASNNFVLWGIYFFIVITIEKFFLKTFLEKHKIISHIYTIFFILIGWTIFAFTDMGALKNYLETLFIYKSGLGFGYYFKNYFLLLVVCSICSCSIVRNVWDKLSKYEFSKTVVLMGIFFLSIAYLVDSSYNPFLYFRF